MKAVARIFVFLLAVFGLVNAEDIFHTSRGKIQDRDGNSITNPMAEGKYTPPEEMDTSFWLSEAQADLEQRVLRPINTGNAKNIIFFLGDGMSIATLTAARILKGQRLGKTGEESKLALEQFPFAGLSKTYCTNGQTPDSACTATAYLCGVKTNMFFLGMNAHATYNNCTESADVNNHVESIATWAQRAGKSTGIVTTTTVTHASPGASYAHVANRMWECDADIVAQGADPSEGCVDIAKQLITQSPGRNFDVILGGGTGKFMPVSEVDPFALNGERLDGVNLIGTWKSQNPTGAVVYSRDDLMNLNFGTTDKILGLFHSSSFEYHHDAPTTNPTQPRLKEMTEAAIRTLQKNENGYFVFIEGGLIDFGHHLTKASLALDETLELDEAISTALAMTNAEDTLIVVSSDHAHTMSIAGYPGRGNPILNINEYDVDLDGIPYNTINYAVGIKQYIGPDGVREDLTGKIDDSSYTPSYIKAKSGTHAGEDVGIFASGPQAHLFSGVLQQNAIPITMAHIADINNARSYAECVAKCGVAK